MHSSLRILQITLIITQITTVKGSSSVFPPTSAVNVDETVASATPPTSASPIRSVTVTSETSIVDSSPVQTGPSMTRVLVTTSTDQLTQASGDSTSFYVTISVSSAMSSEANGTSVKSLALLGSSVTVNSLEILNTSSVSDNATKTESRTIIVLNTNSMTLATKTNNVSDSSTKATNLSTSGLLTRPTLSMTLNYSLSLASRRGSIVLSTAGPKQTTSLPVSVDWTDWSVDSSHCQEYCSEKGGTVTASRQCYSHSKKLEEKVCTRHNSSTKVVKCAEHCPVSGKEAFGSSISTLAVYILLVILSSTFVRD